MGNDLRDEGILGMPRFPEDLPRAEPIIPAHTLLKPALGMLKSSIKYPLREDDMPVYGNLNNLGITYGKTNERVLYTDFRKTNDMLDMLLQTLKKGNNVQRKPIVVYIGPNPRYKKFVEFEEPKNKRDFRRRRDEHIYDYLDSTESSEDFSETSASSDYERNPGNPYTVHKDKYRQNWMWNHFMDGDHMNINPYGPNFNSLGPSGATLFFNRKWWYYNQDDYRPFD
ncbi:uncharacterized protein [Epargyreus clarus]|uniref:uncharacterized protein n=1 Tax=Epargyreus clarus TaxID=520877 RepID=UPI003C3008C1